MEWSRLCFKQTFIILQPVQLTSFHQALALLHKRNHATKGGWQNLLNELLITHTDTHTHTLPFILQCYGARLLSFLFHCTCPLPSPHPHPTVGNISQLKNLKWCGDSCELVPILAVLMPGHKLKWSSLAIWAQYGGDYCHRPFAWAREMEGGHRSGGFEGHLVSW